jgi:pSer/pThr/pTyr-binding forkhead associated (FHA) protein
VFCPSCGFRNSEGAGYCARCGSVLLSESPDSQTTISYLPSSEEGEEKLPERMTPEVPTLVMRSGGSHSGETYPLTAARTSIGRHPAADIFLDDVTVSRNHALIERGDDGFVIVDEGSLNGTYVNRVRTERHMLVDGDELQVGKYKLTFILP